MAVTLSTPASPPLLKKKTESDAFRARMATRRAAASSARALLRRGDDTDSVAAILKKRNMTAIAWQPYSTPRQQWQARKHQTSRAGRRPIQLKYVDVPTRTRAGPFPTAFLFYYYMPSQTSLRIQASKPLLSCHLRADLSPGRCKPLELRARAEAHEMRRKQNMQENGTIMIQFGQQVPNCESSASDSPQEVSGMSEGSFNEQNDQSGNRDGYAKSSDEGKMMSALSLGNSETAYTPPKPDRTHPFAISYPYADPYYGGAVAAYGAHAIMHPQMVGMVPSSRVPLPIEPAAAEEPIYVNAKQYHAILRRRQLRAKLEAENKLVKSRKPYLHESRHQHAMKRARGTGGRFLNAKEKSEASGGGNASARSGHAGVPPDGGMFSKHDHTLPSGDFHYRARGGA
ncbi:Nuclear transcription factor Y subunit A-9 [Triticum urartu]|uniref:Nuclear transcription factor Y subunit n=2 Tax=Triticum urartu TaxID=4572 RepID=M8A1A4_TRIUA|nr:Nuclear transcription factor Y subunit A-9 [Triticum urartu]